MDLKVIERESHDADVNRLIDEAVRHIDEELKKQSDGAFKNRMRKILVKIAWRLPGFIAFFEQFFGDD